MSVVERCYQLEVYIISLAIQHISTQAAKLQRVSHSGQPTSDNTTSREQLASRLEASKPRMQLKPKTSGSNQCDRRQLADEIECFEHAVPVGRLDTVQGDEGV